MHIDWFELVSCPRCVHQEATEPAWSKYRGGRPIPAREYHIGVKLPAVARSDNARLKSEIDTEQVACALYLRADELGVAVTRSYIDEQLTRLRAHSPTCRCSEPCQLSHDVTGYRVHQVARWWVGSVAATRRLARR